MDRGVLDTSVIVKSIFKPSKSLSRENYFIALAKIKNAVLLTDDGKMHFHAKEVGVDSVLIREIDFKGIENKLKADSCD